MSTDPGDVVLDPFLGTGTTAIAAKTLGRHFVGIDIDPEYAKMATEKVENVDVTMYKGYYVSSFLGNMQSIRDIDAGKIFPLQLTSVEKKHLRQSNSCHKAKEREPDMALQTKLWKETNICAAGCPDG
jgi:site-specific DNA-methyltransferase (adenine-specific)